ncbi:hypothetical protein ACOMHN_023439 [Nucella lapillus]
MFSILPAGLIPSTPKKIHVRSTRLQHSTSNKGSSKPPTKDNPPNLQQRILQTSNKGSSKPPTKDPPNLQQRILQTSNKGSSKPPTKDPPNLQQRIL